MKLIVTMPDDTQDIYTEGSDPFMDILGFSYNGETGLFVVSFAAEGVHLKAQNVARGQFEQTYGLANGSELKLKDFRLSFHHFRELCI